MVMIQKIKSIINDSKKVIGDNHLRHVHDRIALSSLKIHNSQSVLTAQEKDAIRALWSPIGYKKSTAWHRLYKSANSFDARYVPNDVYGLELLPRLNATKLLSAWDDKAYYPRFFPDVKQPTAVAFVIDGSFYNCNYESVNIDYLTNEILNEYDKIIIKPSYGLEGRGVEVIDVKNFDFPTLKQKMLVYGRNYVIQEVIEQHDSLAIYNSSSVNPIRVMMLRLGGKIHYLHSTLRFGLPGAHTDISFINGKEIAHVCAVSSKGEISHEWFDMDGKKDSISSLGIDVQPIIPCFERVIETAKNVHNGLHHFDLIGCDFTVDIKGEPILIEYNVYWPGIILPQYCHGPLFGDLTEELIQTLKNRPQK